MDMKRISSRIADAFINSRMSLDDLAMKTGIPRSALHRYMTGETSKIPLDRFEAICSALGLDAAELLGWKQISWDHTIHEWPEQELPEEIEQRKAPDQPDREKIIRALVALGKVDMDSAVTLFKALINEDVL